jgi:hypothetical protein
MIGKTIVDIKFVVTFHYYHHFTPSNTYHPPHMFSHISLIITSSKEQVTICVYQYMKNTIKIQIS